MQNEKENTTKRKEQQHHGENKTPRIQYDKHEQKKENSKDVITERNREHKNKNKESANIDNKTHCNTSNICSIGTRAGVCVLVYSMRPLQKPFKTQPLRMGFPYRRGTKSWAIEHPSTGRPVKPQLMENERYNRKRPLSIRLQISLAGLRYVMQVSTVTSVGLHVCASRVTSRTHCFARSRY